MKKCFLPDIQQVMQGMKPGWLKMLRNNDIAALVVVGEAVGAKWLPRFHLSAPGQLWLQV